MSTNNNNIIDEYSTPKRGLIRPTKQKIKLRDYNSRKEDS